MLFIKCNNYNNNKIVDAADLLWLHNVQILLLLLYRRAVCLVPDGHLRFSTLASNRAELIIEKLRAMTFPTNARKLSTKITTNKFHRCNNKNIYIVWLINYNNVNATNVCVCVCPRKEICIYSEVGYVRARARDEIIVVII